MVVLFHRFDTHVPDLVHYWAFWYITNINQLIYIFNIYTPLSRPLAPVLAEIGIAWILGSLQGIIIWFLYIIIYYIVLTSIL